MRGLVSIHQNFKLCWVPLVSFISYYLFVYYLIFIESFYIRWDNFKVSYRWNKRLSSSTRRTSCEKNKLVNSRVEALSTFHIVKRAQLRLIVLALKKERRRKPTSLSIISRFTSECLIILLLFPRKLFFSFRASSPSRSRRFLWYFITSNMIKKFESLSCLVNFFCAAVFNKISVQFLCFETCWLRISRR